ncbi:unnamed protein product [Thelazia callipaeda]|uniref:Cystatin domain-containing protein n=1 Tax=Thelazia callipaeda TaxID=103827 RepID=A0A0N5D093_THECL|nr:unnamed protein product [Thelazia callipaeda]
MHDSVAKVEKLVADMTHQLIASANRDEYIEVELKMLFGKFVKKPVKIRQQRFAYFISEQYIFITISTKRGIQACVEASCLDSSDFVCAIHQWLCQIFTFKSLRSNFSDYNVYKLIQHMGRHQINWAVSFYLHRNCTSS